MFVLPLILSVAVAPFVLGQDNLPLEIEAVEAHFNNSGLVPSLLANFTPTAVFSLAFEGTDGTVQPGQAFTDKKVAPTPNLTITGGNFTAEELFTLAMVDAGPVGSDQSQGQTRHWLVNGVTLTGEKAPFTVSTANGTAITQYAGPAPPAGSGAHRYVILLYTQPSTFVAPEGLTEANIGVSTFDFPAYVESSHLGELVAGTYFTVEEGTATASPSSTAPVVTSTLPAAVSPSKTGSSAAPSSTSPGDNQTGSASVSKVISFSAVFAAVAAVVVLN
ncbi:phosphatidylethanolamine-binding protein [Cristinia sonorae]|uniref:Phosphatidylethanolamine-binding protein n=1 Tax=Cristinia sonorae TaxID=1940300 RepID=A0A8K0XRP8_9AGAR|nr:phosphatidylethanolamine-binding protein [Cristinia sonorae]